MLRRFNPTCEVAGFFFLLSNMHEKDDAQLDGKGKATSVHRQSCGEATRQHNLVLRGVQLLS